MQTPSLFDIYDAHFNLGKVAYPRPCLIFAVSSTRKFSTHPISSAFDLYRGKTVHFRINRDDPDFITTGLTKDCYIIGDEVATLEIHDLIRKRGQLEGELLQRFKHWFE